MFARPELLSDVDRYVRNLAVSDDDRLKRQEFNTRLLSYYRRKWQVPLIVPKVNGRAVDLYTLYAKVCALGGWRKVCTANKWPIVYEHCKLSETMCGGDHVLKNIYMQYLSRFEYYSMTGDDSMAEGGYSRGGGTGSRHSKSTPSTAFVIQCPIAKPRAPVSTHARRMAGMQQIVKHKGQQTIDGIDNSSSIFDIAPSSASTSASPLESRDDPRFDVLYKSLLSGLPNEVDFALNTCTLLSHPGPRFIDISRCPRLLKLMIAHVGVFDDESSGGDLTAVYAAWRTSWPKNRSFDTFWRGNVVDPADTTSNNKHFHNTSEFRLKDTVSWRIYQVACIIRNISFESMNKPTLAASRPLRKLCYMCISCASPQLQCIAWDILSNVTGELSVASMPLAEQYTMHELLTTCLSTGEQCKTHLVRACETLGGMCTRGNREYVREMITPEVLVHLTHLLTVTDIMIVVYVLELIYALSELGDHLCDVLAGSAQVLKILIDMTTIEAVSFGKRGLDGMKVVEYASSSANKAQRTPLPPCTPGRPLAVSRTTAWLPGPSPLQSDTIVASSMTSAPAMSPAHAHTHKWIETHVKYERSSSVNRAVLYAAYVDDMQKVHNMLAVSMHVFVHMLRGKYSALTVRNGSNATVYIDGLVHDIASAHPLMHSMLNNGTSVGEHDAKASVSPTQDDKDTAVCDVKDVKEEPSEIGALTEAVLTNGPTKAPSPPTVVDPPPLVNGTSTVVNQNGTGDTTVKIVKVITTGDAAKRPQLNGQRVVKTVRIINNNIKLIKTHTNGNHNTVVNGAAASRTMLVTDDATLDEDGFDQPTIKRARLLNDKSIMPPPATTNTSIYVCRWRSCHIVHTSLQALQYHVSTDHLHSAGADAICEWGDTCDLTRRSRWSLCTHLNEQHVNDAQLTQAMNRPVRICGVNTARAPAPSHAGYSATAAVDAIRRHALLHTGRHKDITDDPEGPVTRSLRLTSSLILRNLSKHSAVARAALRPYEARLAHLAMSQLEGGQALAQCLAQLQQEDTPPQSNNDTTTAPHL